jgi:DNA-binding transcriptional LysR family regulator
VEIQQLRYFLTTSENLNYSLTAEKYYTTRQAVSHSVHALEKELEVKLFDQANNKLYLTAEGAEFAKRAKKTIKSIDDLTKDFAKRFTEKPDVLKLSIDTIYLMKRVNDFNSYDIFGTSQDTYLKVNQAGCEVCLNNVLNRQSDISIIRCEEEQFAKCESIVLKKRLLSLLVHPNNPLAKKTAVDIEDLQGQHFIVPSDYEFRFRSLLRECLNKGVEFQADYCINEGGLAVEVASRNLGIIVTFVDENDEATFQGDLRQVPFSEPEFAVYDCIIYRGDSPKLRNIKAFIDRFVTERRLESWDLR